MYRDCVVRVIMCYDDRHQAEPYAVFRKKINSMGDTYRDYNLINMGDIHLCDL